jgi:hypothetical protein
MDEFTIKVIGLKAKGRTHIDTFLGSLMQAHERHDSVALPGHTNRRDP